MSTAEQGRKARQALFVTIVAAACDAAAVGVVVSVGETVLIGSPVMGSRMSVSVRAGPAKLNRLFNVPAVASNDWLPMRPRFQLSSMKRRIELWLATEKGFSPPQATPFQRQ
jgi:hypothetical protein